VHEEITVDAEAAPLSAMNSLAPFVSADDAPKGPQDDNSDGVDSAGSPQATTPKGVSGRSML
jgi:hypothetical protein